MNENVSSCPSCLGNRFSSLIDFGTVPLSGAFLPAPDSTPVQIPLSFEYCEQCALIRQNWQRDLPPHNYVHIPRATARQLPAYTREIARSLRRSGLAPRDLVIEIGANDGAFLDMLSEEGHTNLLGVEPSSSCVQINQAKGHHIEEACLDVALANSIRSTHGPASAVICRHTLEHVTDPIGFIEAMRLLLRPGGLLFIEVPGSNTVIHDLFGHELWDEHLHLFSPNNLAALVVRLGFSITRLAVWPLRSTSNILLWAYHEPSAAANVPRAMSFSADLMACATFKSRWQTYAGMLHQELKLLPGPVAAIGASHPQSNFLLFTELGDTVSALIDDDPVKVDKYVPLPKLVPVLASEQFLRQSSVRTVLLTAFGYESWMEKLMAPLIAHNVHVIKPYELRFLSPVRYGPMSL